MGGSRRSDAGWGSPPFIQMRRQLSCDMTIDAVHEPLTDRLRNNINGSNTHGVVMVGTENGRG